jgi:hypothetical protein
MFQNFLENETKIIKSWGCLDKSRIDIFKIVDLVKIFTRTYEW